MRLSPCKCVCISLGAPLLRCLILAVRPRVTSVASYSGTSACLFAATFNTLVACGYQPFGLLLCGTSASHLWRPYLSAAGVIPSRPSRPKSSRRLRPVLPVPFCNSSRSSVFALGFRRVGCQFKNGLQQCSVVSPVPSGFGRIAKAPG